MKFNVSHVRAHLECPTKGRYQHVLKRGPHKRPLALEIGTLWHIGMETLLRTQNMVEAMIEVNNSLTTAETKVVSGWRAIEPAFEAWPDRGWLRQWEILAVEQLVEYEITKNLTIQGTLDGLVKWEGQYWHLQHKTLSPSTPLHTYAAYMQRDWHECWYEFACREAGYAPFGGTILNVVRKLSAKTIAADPAQALSVQYIPRPYRIVEKAMEDLASIGGDLAYDIGTNIQNRSMCAGRFGNSLCPYLDVCNGVAQIDDNELFTNIEDRYAHAGAPLAQIEHE